MSKKKSGNYNQDHFKVGGTPQPGGDVLHAQEKQKIATGKDDTGPPGNPRSGAGQDGDAP